MDAEDSWIDNGFDESLSQSAAKKASAGFQFSRVKAGRELPTETTPEHPYIVKNAQ